MWCDIEVCSKTGIIGFLHELLIEHGWFKRLLSSRENSYRDLTLEFLATLTFNLDDANPILSFQLCGISRVLTLAQFGQILGLTHDPSAKKRPSQAEATERKKMWDWMTGGARWDSSHTSDMRVLHLGLRYLHRCMSMGFLGVHSSAHHITSAQLDLFRHIIWGGADNRFDLTSFIASHLYSVTPQSHSPTKAIAIGGIVTLIAKHFGFEESPERLEARKDDFTTLNEDFLRGGSWLVTIQLRGITTLAYQPEPCRAIACPIPLSRLSLSTPRNVHMPSMVGDFSRPSSKGRWVLVTAERRAMVVVDDESEEVEEEEEERDATGERENHAGESSSSSGPHSRE